MNTYQLVQLSALSTVLATYLGDTIEIGDAGLVQLMASGRPVFTARLPEGYALIVQSPAQ